MLKKIAIVAFTFCFCMVFSAKLRAEDAPPTQSEAEEAAAEDAEAAKLDGEVRSPLTRMAYHGQYISQPGGDDASAVLGYFKNKDHTYLVKVLTDDMKKELDKLNGKEINVEGKERNKGKYLIVLRIMPDDDRPLERRKHRGF